jgi:hypothetical protein
MATEKPPQAGDKFTHKGKRYVIASALKEDACKGCAASSDDEESLDVTSIDALSKLCSEINDKHDCASNNHIVFVHDTKAGRALYAIARLEGMTEDDV